MHFNEYQAKNLYASCGLPVPTGRFVQSLVDAQTWVSEIGFPCMVKAQVSQTRRLLKGGVRIAENNEDLEKIVSELLISQIHGERVSGVLIEEKIPIIREFY
ncbi:MAG: hypothetical protein GF384_07625, partial [Elusimicrobia bacterium]|nr:hypothetical protein [Elusimicrobiota bacterium]MBD3412520.1 hypothetical protein [Elusimicrobiota bacterium]